LGATAGRLHLNTMGLSAKIALFLGLALLFFATFGFLTVAAAHLRGRLLTPEQSEDILEGRRAQILSWTAVSAMGLTLVLLSLAGAGGATAAHLGLAPAPAPLDWLTLFTVITFVAGFISVGRRGLLESR